MTVLYSGESSLSLHCSDVDAVYMDKNSQHYTEYKNKQEAHFKYFKAIKSQPFRFERLESQEENTQRSKMLFNTRNKVATTVKRHRLKNYMRAMVPYMDVDQKAYWRQLFCQLLIAEIYEYNFYCALNRKQLLAGKVADLEYYVAQIKYIDGINSLEATEPSLIWTNDKLGLKCAPGIKEYVNQWFSGESQSFEEAPNAATRSWLDYLNWYRLYWVWAGGSGGLLGSILDLEPMKKWLGRDTASKRLESVSPYTGLASWEGYVLRFGLHGFLMGKHTLWHPWLSEEEKDVDWQTRFLAQADQRKHRMLNDLAWGYVNFASMYWYTSSISPYLGMIGAAINVLLMAFDLGMAHLKLHEQNERYSRARIRILEKIEQVKLQGITPGRERLLMALHDELCILEINWRYEKKELEFVRLSAFLFTPVMALIFAFILPTLFPAIAFSAALISGLVFIGCLASVLLTAWETQYCAQLEIEKRNELQEGALQKLKQIQQMHGIISSKEAQLTPEELNQLRLCHLEHKRLMLECESMKAEQSHIFNKMLHSVLVQLLFPAVVLGCLFLPIVPALIIIIGALLLALTTRACLESKAPKTMDEFSNNGTKDFKAIDLTKEEAANPRQSLYLLPGYKNDYEVIEENKSSSILGKYGLFTTTHAFVENIDVPSIKCAI